VDKNTAHEPDALVYWGKKLASSAIEVPNPVVVVEVLSPTTRHIEASAKLAGYFKLPSVHHYLIVDPEKRLVIHHSRSTADLIVTRLARKGTLDLVPPGLKVPVARLLGTRTDSQ
jgi:Uma2 family endonuclease